jgi:hypothetical protein
MRFYISIILFFCASISKAQDSIPIQNNQIFIDSLSVNQYFKIESVYSTCFTHKSYRIIISKKLNNYNAQVKIISTYNGDNPKTVKTFKPLNITQSQIDSIRNFERYLNIYPTADTDGQRYYLYTLSLGKKQKLYFDGVQTDPWMRIEGLVRVLFPTIKPD